MRLFRYLMFAIIIAWSMCAGADVPSFVGVGDLPGGSVASKALAVSGNGAVVVGTSKSDDGESGPARWEAFRWNSAGGIQGLGDLLGGDFDSAAHGASANGSVIVGLGKSDDGQAGPSRNEAFRWTGTPLGEDEDAGLGDLDGGPFHSYAQAVSASGSVVVGASR